VKLSLEKNGETSDPENLDASPKNRKKIQKKISEDFEIDLFDPMSMVMDDLANMPPIFPSAKDWF
jgi:hypothetical protein